MQLDAPLGSSRPVPGPADPLRAAVFVTVVVTLFVAKLELAIDLPSGELRLWKPLALVTLALAVWLAFAQPRALFQPTLETTLLGPGLRRDLASDPPTSPSPQPEAVMHADDAAQAEGSTRPYRITALVFAVIFLFFGLREVWTIGDLTLVAGICFTATGVLAAVAMLAGDRLIRQLFKRR
ncbi:MAG: hypothetical protein KDG52_07505 [Rhodocyclaceae bacterium]|nr:hypothetical protein [Rhodocyclaceae bacterium]